ncbi:DUF6090 family protein [Muriicola sp. Z0-33]|uniref:DUF6090 family protein n=1 Tax=Muriicola sp. Z0-33 TaxID=2816957 RepID=UPI0022385221|nr:DUF6090 family protein [Muriicola sp. Z0-33]MCW5515438.1 hypothetical protein [Muriicola sp. Z0-33]
MLKFFRKIRQQLLTENKFSKYIVYAIGEILLVVIGILIALQINNMNEARKTEKFEHQILNDILIALEDNIFRNTACLKSNKNSIASVDIILKQLEENTGYHDSLAYHFSKSLTWCSPSFQNAGYESLKTYGRNLITNDTIREYLGIYDAGWMENLSQRQEDFFFHTANPVLINLFEKVAMRTKMIPIDYKELKQSKTYLNILRTLKAYREDQIRWQEEWNKSFNNLYKMILRELKKKE